MKAIAQRRETASADVLLERILCHDVRDAAGKIAVPKGAQLDASSVETLLATPWEEIHLLALEPGDVHEEEAGRRLAAAVVGEGAEVKAYTGGQWTLAAARRGLLHIDTARLADANAHEGISVFTLFSGQPVETGEIVAKAKVTPLAIPEPTLREIEAQGRGLVSIVGFRPTTIGAVASERLEPRQRARFESALKQKVDWFGSRLLPVRFSSASDRAVADELRALRREGARVLIVAGASALDPLDPVFSALTMVGAPMERHGAPAHPGSLLWLARWDGAPVLGMPTCGMFSQATTFDLVLPRLLAGEAIGNRELAGLGHGGLLSREMAYRFPPYRANAARGELE
ncbi:MAG TPA: hypothetical protein VMQ51_05300 [Candidatus Binatia bacterium]|nr:hypothetical protein [Candidatus Binatia bacterium]